MKNLIWVLVLLTACQVPNVSTAPDTNTEIADPVAKTPSTPDPVEPDPVTPSTVSLTYYTLSKTEAPVNGWPTKMITTVASCVIYLTQTYCWDDGLKSMTWVSQGHTYGPYTYTYWDNEGNGPCTGGCTQDNYAEPTLATGLTPSEVNKVFNLGVAHPVECDETDTGLTCGDFDLGVN